MQIKIKQEKFSDSEDDRKGSLIVKKRDSDSSSDSDSSEDSDGSGINHLRTVKKEKVTSESSNSSNSSSSSSSDDSGSENGDLLANRIKKEKDDDSSFAVPALPIVSRPIKSEPMSDVEGGGTHKKSPVIASKKRTLSMSERLDSVLADAVRASSEKNSENGSAKKKRKWTLLDETNLADLTAKFRSPSMSSTLIPKASPAKVKKEVQSEDERPKKKKTKSSTKSSLENFESELFKNYEG